MPRHPPCALLSLTNWSSLMLESLLGFSLAKFIVVLADLPCLLLYFAFCFLFFIQFPRYSSQLLLNPIPPPLPDVSIFLQRESPPAQLVVGSSGLEPPTSRLSGVRSNHLSYEPISLVPWRLVPRPFRCPFRFTRLRAAPLSVCSCFSAFRLQRSWWWR